MKVADVIVAGMVKLQSITTELMVDDIDESMAFYIHILGFSCILAEPKEKPFFVILKNGPVELMLYQREQFSEEIPAFETPPVGGTIALYIGVENISSFYSDIKDKVKIIQKMHKTNYGTLEFSCEDCNGYVLMFNESATEKTT